MIRERKSSWGVRIYRGGGEWTWVGTFPFDRYGGKRKARDAAVRAEQAAKDRTRRWGSSDETCGDFAARWPKDWPRPSLHTQQTYRYALVPFVRRFADVPLAELDRDMARRWAAGQPASQIHCLRAMFNDALEDDLVQRNPFEKMGRARKRGSAQVGGKKQIWVPTPAELDRIADLAIEVHGEEYGPTFRAYILFLAYTGMRPGELAVLETDCVDRRAKEIHVVRNLDGTGAVNDYTKNGRQRTIALLSAAEVVLDTYPTWIDQRGVGGFPLLFLGPKDGVLGKGTRGNLWRPVRSAFGRPKMRLYDLRHTCATFLLERGASDLDVSVQLGHTDGGALVRSTYGHAERSSLDRLRALDSPQVTPLRDANETQGRKESA